MTKNWNTNKSKSTQGGLSTGIVWDTYDWNKKNGDWSRLWEGHTGISSAESSALLGKGPNSVTMGTKVLGITT